MIWLNLACLGFTVAGALILGIKGDDIRGWYIYTIAASIGIVYFFAMDNLIQVVLWTVFLANDLYAIRRKRKQRKDDAEKHLYKNYRWNRLW